MFVEGISEGELLDAIVAAQVPEMQPGDVTITALEKRLGMNYEKARGAFEKYLADNADTVVVVRVRHPKTGKTVDALRRK